MSVSVAIKDTYKNTYVQRDSGKVGGATTKFIHNTKCFLIHKL